MRTGIPPPTITEDFLRRLAGQSSILTGEDILLAVEAYESALAISYVEGEQR